MTAPDVHRTIADLSRFFLGRDASAIDEGIREKLPVTAALAGADRTRLILVRGREAFQFDWQARDAPNPAPLLEPAALRAKRFRWGAALLAQRRIMHVPVVADMPDAAAPEREDLQRRGVRSTLVVPVCAGDQVMGYQIFERTRQQRGWTDDQIVLLRLVGEIFGYAIQRRWAEEELARQRAGEGRVTELSSHLLSAPADRVEQAIRDGLAELAELAGADRVWLLAVDFENRGRSAHWEWCGPGVESGPLTPMAWATPRLIAGEVIHVHRLDELPEGAERERQELARRGVKSLLGVPIGRRRGHIGAFLGLEARRTRRWSEHEVTLLRLVGNLFSSALRRRRVEDALRQRELQLFQSQKMEAVGRLAGGIAHDFNNLLSVILGFSGPLLKEIGEGHALREELTTIHDAAQRAAGLTRQLLEFSRRQPPALGAVDLNALIGGLRMLLRGVLAEDVELVTDLDAGLVPVRGHTGQLEQVLVNLAVNARDAMPDGGRFAIRTEPRQLVGIAASRLGLEPGAYALLEVSDSGCGMDREVRARIFDPFFTTKEPGKGSGLGLSIVYSIVEQAGGAIAVDGEAGKGTTFSIYLPNVPAEAL